MIEESNIVSQVSEKALTALSLATPVQLLVSALGLGNAVRLNAVISKALGRKDTGEVRRAADGRRKISMKKSVGIAITFIFWWALWDVEGAIQIRMRAILQSGQVCQREQRFWRIML